jgi:hypothetical protein
MGKFSLDVACCHVKINKSFKILCSSEKCLSSLLAMLDKSVHITKAPKQPTSGYFIQRSAAMFSAREAQQSVTQSACDVFH